MVREPRDDEAYEQAYYRQYLDDRAVLYAHVEASHSIEKLTEALLIAEEDLIEAKSREAVAHRMLELQSRAADHVVKS